MCLGKDFLFLAQKLKFWPKSDFVLAFLVRIFKNKKLIKKKKKKKKVRKRSLDTRI